MSDSTITLAVLAVVVVLFVWNRYPVELVAIGSARALYFAGVLDLAQALAGCGDPAVILIAALFVVSEGIDSTGVTAWDTRAPAHEPMWRTATGADRDLAFTRDGKLLLRATSTGLASCATTYTYWDTWYSYTANCTTTVTLGTVHALAVFDDGLEEVLAGGVEVDLAVEGDGPQTG